jgi:putative addiction module killer protein
MLQHDQWKPTPIQTSTKSPFCSRSLWATMNLVEIQRYARPSGRVPVSEWLRRLGDRATAARIYRRIDRLSSGLRGDWKYVGNGVCELRINFGAGYRVYFAEDGPRLVLLLCGGAKNTQAKDIERAHAYWKEYKERPA